MDNESGPINGKSAIQINGDHETNANEHETNANEHSTDDGPRGDKNGGRKKSHRSKKGGDEGESGHDTESDTTTDAHEVKQLKKKIAALKADKTKTPKKFTPKEKSKEACRNFLKGGYCNWGDKCGFTHAADADADAADTDTKAPVSNNQLRKEGKCFTHIKKPGQCAAGDSCKFSHEVNMMSHSVTMRLKPGDIVSL